jgi:hypothetical protein
MTPVPCKKFAGNKKARRSGLVVLAGGASRPG